MATKKAAPKKLQAVICDDDAMTRTYLRSLLERCGYEVLAGVGTAVEALQLAVTYQPDVLVLDLSLPAMSGEEVIESVRQAAPNCAIVIFSSFDPSAAIRNGALYIVPKGETTRLETTLLLVAERAGGVAV